MTKRTVSTLGTYQNNDYLYKAMFFLDDLRLPHIRSGRGRFGPLQPISGDYPPSAPYAAIE